jgi:hypothetical protein
VGSRRGAERDDDVNVGLEFEGVKLSGGHEEEHTYSCGVNDFRL